jgi:hypothetical protein
MRAVKLGEAWHVQAIEQLHHALVDARIVDDGELLHNG